MRNLSLLMMTFGIICFFTAPSNAYGYSPRVGQVHPNFILPNITDRAPVSLSQYRGRKILLIHFASW